MQSTDDKMALLRADQPHRFPNAKARPMSAITNAEQETLAVYLSDGATVSLPVVRPIFKLWRGVAPQFTFGGKPVIERDGEPCFAEYAIMRDRQASGWNAVWTSAYGGFRCFQTMPDSWKARADATIPATFDALLRAIWQAGNTKACPDVLAWQDDQILFPSVPMKMRHRPAGNLDLRARKDHLSHAHAPETD